MSVITRNIAVPAALVMKEEYNLCDFCILLFSACNFLSRIKEMQKVLDISDDYIHQVYSLLR